MSGRISDVVIHPKRRATWYVAVGSGGVWKTENAGTTWTTIFDDQPSYSIGCITLDPSNPETVWVGTGENVSGRHVGYGDGVYKSLNGGKTWTNMGLKALRAHRPHPGRSAQLVGRLRRRRGAAVVAGRRARPLQVHRRRQDVDGVPLHLEGHGRHLGRDGPVESRHPLRGRLPAPAHGGRVRGRRPGVGHLQERGRRQDVAQAHRRPAQGRRREDRPRGVAHRPARRVRHDRGDAGRARLLPLVEPGRELREAQPVHQRRHRPALLPGDLRRPERVRPGLPDEPGPDGDARRRKDVRARPREEQARRQPRDGVRAGRSRLHPERQRRRPLRDARPGRDLAVLREPAA